MSGYEGFAAATTRGRLDMTEDVEFYVGLAGEAEGPIVELAVGTGGSRSRSRSDGKSVIGIDPSPGMLERRPQTQKRQESS